MTGTKRTAADLTPARRRRQRKGPRRIANRLALMGSTLVLAAFLGAPVVRAGGTITVTTIDQEINGDADCSLQEAIYAANLDASLAPDHSHPGTFFTTGCTAGSGADTI